LTEAYKDGCKLLDLDPATGLAPKEGEEKKTAENKGEKKEAKEKRTALKSDSSVDTGLPEYQHKLQNKDKDDKPKTTREILSEQANEMAANGTNPWRTAP
jgi:predicted nucleotide-binding protein